MSSKLIRIDGELFQIIQNKAGKYGMQFSTPCNVLRRMLKLPYNIDKTNTQYPEHK